MSLKNQEWLDLSEVDLKIPAEFFASELSQRKNSKGGVLILDGPMGVGKSTFARALIKKLIPKQEFRGSPSFPILQEYCVGELPIYHLDLYRVKSAQELIDAGIEAALYEDPGIVMLEWPDIISDWSRVLFEKPPVGPGFWLKFEFGKNEGKRNLKLVRLG